MKRIANILIMTFLFSGMLTAQEGDDFINDLIYKVNSYFRQHNEMAVYLHTDREIYFPGEKVMAAVYVSDAQSGRLSEKCEKISIGLIDRSGKMLFVQDVPVSFGIGNTEIPLPFDGTDDSYLVYAWPEGAAPGPVLRPFLKVIRVTDPAGDLYMSADLVPELIAPGQTPELKTLILKNNGQAVKNADVSYSFIAEQDKVISAKSKTDPTGEAAFRFMIPENFSDQMVQIRLDAAYRKSETAMNLYIPVDYPLSRLNFSPEGGILLAGVKNKVLVTATDLYGRPKTAKGKLTDSSAGVLNQVDIPESGSILYLTPVKGEKYSIKLDDGAEYRLPEVSSRGLAVSISEPGNDLLAVSTIAAGIGQGERIYVVLHRKGVIFWASSGTSDQLGTFSVPVNRIPEGIAALTFFDGNGTVLAERMAFLPGAGTPELDIKLNNSHPSARKKVEVTVQLTNAGSGLLDPQVLSVSVAPSMLCGEHPLTLKAQLLLQSDLDTVLSAPDNYLSEKAISGGDLDRLLLSAGRKGFEWSELTRTPEEGLSGYRKYLSERLLPVFREDALTHFDQTQYQLFSEQVVDKRRQESKKEHYQLMLENGTPVLDVIKTMKTFTLKGNKIIFPGGQNSILYQAGALIVIDEQVMGDDISSIQRLSPSEVETIRVSTEPSDIQRYTGLNSVGLIEITLKGSILKGRLNVEDPRDEYVNSSAGYLPDYPNYSFDSDIRNISSDNRATIFWEPLLVTDEEGKASFSFYTSDMKGEYTGLVQGIYKGIPLSATFNFTVR